MAKSKEKANPKGVSKDKSSTKVKSKSDSKARVKDKGSSKTSTKKSSLKFDIQPSGLIEVVEERNKLPGFEERLLKTVSWSHVEEAYLYHRTSFLKKELLAINAERVFSKLPPITRSRLDDSSKVSSRPGDTEPTENTPVDEGINDGVEIVKEVSKVLQEDKIDYEEKLAAIEVALNRLSAIISHDNPNEEIDKSMALERMSKKEAQSLSKLIESIQPRQQSFSEALRNKIKNSTLNNFMVELQGILPDNSHKINILDMLEWDKKFYDEREMMCYEKNNNIIPDLIDKLRIALQKNEVVDERWFAKHTSVLRLPKAQVDYIDKDLKAFENVCALNLGANYLRNVEGIDLPPCLRFLELHCNFLTNVASLVAGLPKNVHFVGLSRNLLNEKHALEAFAFTNVRALDLAQNNLYNLLSVLDALTEIKNLESLSLEGNPCSVCPLYKATTLSRLPWITYFDNYLILPTDLDTINEKDLIPKTTSGSFLFCVHRVLCAPKPEKNKSVNQTYHLEMELPLLDKKRLDFLLYNEVDQLITRIESSAPPTTATATTTTKSEEIKSKKDAKEKNKKEPKKKEEAEKKSKKGKSPEKAGKEQSNTGNKSGGDSIAEFQRPNEYSDDEVINFTRFETPRVEWSPCMSFGIPSITIHTDDLKALRDTFRTNVTVSLVYLETLHPAKSKKEGSRSNIQLIQKRITMAKFKCDLKTPSWPRQYQDFHWAPDLRSDEALDWGSGDLGALIYNDPSVKPAKVAKPQKGLNKNSSKIAPPSEQNDNSQEYPKQLMCHVGFGIFVHGIKFEAFEPPK